MEGGESILVEQFIAAVMNTVKVADSSVKSKTPSSLITLVVGDSNDCSVVPVAPAYT